MWNEFLKLQRSNQIIKLEAFSKPLLHRHTDSLLQIAVNHLCSDGALNDRIIGCLWVSGVLTIARMKIQYPSSFSAPLEFSPSEKKILQLGLKVWLLKKFSSALPSLPVDVQTSGTTFELVTPSLKNS